MKVFNSEKYSSLVDLMFMSVWDIHDEVNQHVGVIDRVGDIITIAHDEAKKIAQYLDDFICVPAQIVSGTNEAKSIFRPQPAGNFFQKLVIGTHGKITGQINENQVICTSYNLIYNPDFSKYPNAYGLSILSDVYDEVLWHLTDLYMHITHVEDKDELQLSWIYHPVKNDKNEVMVIVNLYSKNPIYPLTVMGVVLTNVGDKADMSYIRPFSSDFNTSEWMPLVIKQAKE